MTSWKVAEAKAHLSELINEALQEEAQEITRHCRRAVVVVSAKEPDRRARRKESLVEFLEKSPLRVSGLKIERLRDWPRDAISDRSSIWSSLHF